MKRRDFLKTTACFAAFPFIHVKTEPAKKSIILWTDQNHSPFVEFPIETTEALYEVGWETPKEDGTSKCLVVKYVEKTNPELRKKINAWINTYWDMASNNLWNYQMALHREAMNCWASSDFIAKNPFKPTPYRKMFTPGALWLWGLWGGEQISKHWSGLYPQSSGHCVDGTGTLKLRFSTFRDLKTGQVIHYKPYAPTNWDKIAQTINSQQSQGLGYNGKIAKSVT